MLSFLLFSDQQVDGFVDRSTHTWLLQHATYFRVFSHKHNGSVALVLISCLCQDSCFEGLKCLSRRNFVVSSRFHIHPSKDY